MDRLPTIAFFALLAYLIGSIPFGYLIGRLKGIDIRKHGSKNIGATNVTRTLGKPWGYACFLLDALKGALPVFVVMSIEWVPGHEHPELPAVVALATVLGHIFPVYLKFKGGKGVSTIIGALIVLTPLPVAAGLITWVIVFFASRYVSLASIAMSVMLPVAAGILPHLIPEYCRVTHAELILLILLGVVSIVKHHANIVRLCQGTEHRFGSPKGEKS